MPAAASGERVSGADAEADMPNLTIKEIPEHLLEQLRRRAAHRRHSINREVILCLGRATELPVFEPSRWLVDADRLRARLDLPPLTAQVLRRGSASR
jgi:plasmid stability protein